MSTAQPHHVVLIPGDGIGPEVTEAAVRVVEAAGARIAWERVEAGGDVIAKYGTPIPDHGAERDPQRRGRPEGPHRHADRAGASRARTWCCARRWSSTPACGP